MAALVRLGHLLFLQAAQAARQAQAGMPGALAGGMAQAPAEAAPHTAEAVLAAEAAIVMESLMDQLTVIYSRNWRVAVAGAAVNLFTGPDITQAAAGGGGGGGAIEISSVGALTLAGNINAHGGGGNLGGAGYGSGGAGGGVLLSGSRISLTATGQVNANGGDVISYSSPGADGGGGGGRITIQTIIPNGLLDNGTLNVNGGLGSYHGEAGVITVITAVPEPGAGSLLVAVLGAVPVVAALRRRRK